MNILVINWRCIRNPEAGGAEVHLHEIFKRIVANGHRVTLVAHSFPGAAPEETIDGINTIHIGNKFFFHYQFRNYYLRHFAHDHFDLVVDDISKIPLNTHRYVRQPLVGIIHHLHGRTLFRELFWPMACYIYRKEKAIPRNYSDVPMFTVSESTRKELIELGYNPGKIDILHNAIDHSLFRKTVAHKNNSPTLVYFGRIKKYKRIEHIIDALALILRRIPDVRLKIAGIGDHLPALQQYSKQKNLTPYIDFVGPIKENEKAELLGNASLFVTTSQKEGWGITVIEANAAGTPVVAYDVPGLRDSIVHNETGILVPDNNVQLLAESISQLLQQPERLAIMSAKARAWSERFTWDASAWHFIEKVQEFYPELKRNE